jgi:periplasmic protein TonB
MVTADTAQDTAGRARTALRTRRALSGFIVVSVAAHVAVLVVLPELERQADPPPVVLDVTLVEPKPLPVAPPEPEQPPPKRKPEPQRLREPARAVVTPPPTPQPEQAPVLALPSTQAPAESAFTVPAPAESPRGQEQKPQGAGVAVTPPAFGAAYLRNPAPNYPLAARRTGQQGTTTVRVLVTPEGLPARVDLEKSSGSMHLDNAAVEAVKGWRFVPARRGTEAVEGWVLVPIVFRLEG